MVHLIWNCRTGLNLFFLPQYIWAIFGAFVAQLRPTVGSPIYSTHSQPIAALHKVYIMHFNEIRINKPNFHLKWRWYSSCSRSYDYSLLSLSLSLNDSAYLNKSIHWHILNRNIIFAYEIFGKNTSRHSIYCGCMRFKIWGKSLICIVEWN